MGKNVVVCSDGTGNTYDSRVTNVTRLVKCLDLDDPERQLVVYDQGVGTSAGRAGEVRGHDAPALRMLDAPIGRGLWPTGLVNRARGLLSGYGLKENLLQMYRVLADDLDPSDRLFLFGFSRGAFTVRALAALLHRCHLAPPGSPDVDQRFELSWSLLQPMDADTDAVEALRAENRPAPVHFLGVWDTVKSYGGLTPVILPHLRHNPDVAHVRHALALDERRAWFKHTTWGQLDGDREHAMTRLDPGDAGAFAAQDIGEVWFTGCHSDIGGGGEETSSTRITLRWMLSEASNVSPPLLLGPNGSSLIRDGDPQEPPTITESFSTAWRVMEQIRRSEIDNSGVYPKRVRHRGSDGKRNPDLSRRGGVVTVHSTARRPSIESPLSIVETSGPKI